MLVTHSVHRVRCAFHNKRHDRLIFWLHDCHVALRDTRVFVIFHLVKYAQHRLVSNYNKTLIEEPLQYLLAKPIHKSLKRC